MRASALAVSAALFGLSYAQFAGLPDCAKTCLNDFVSGSTIGGCSSIDIHCICSSGGFLDSIACCLTASCDAADITSTIQFAKEICATAEPPVVVPSEAICSSTTSKPATSAPATSKAAASTPATSESATSKPASSGSATPTGSDTSEPAGAVTAATTATTKPLASSSASAAAASSSTAAAALHKAGGVGVGFAGGLAAALVLL